MLIDTSQLTQQSFAEHPQRKQIYNGLDCCITFEVFEQLQGLFNQEPEIYGWERALQGPILEIMLRGFRVDEVERQENIKRLEAELEQLQATLDEFAFAVWDKGLNPNSPIQLKTFFYKAMALPEQWISEKGERKLSMKREVLEKLEVFFYAMPIVATILAIRERKKQLETLRTEIDADGRMRTSYNIAGTETGRLSSSSNAFGTGGNLQNIMAWIRQMYIADTNKKLCVIDLEQAEARELGYVMGLIFGDWTYLDNCESGDLHTNNCKLIWPGLGWTGDPKKDREIADQIFYREFSYRDMSKRGGHALNYYGTPWTIARHLKVPVKLIEDFSRAYFAAFPCFPKFHQWVATELQTSFNLTTIFGRQRHFYGRPGDDATLREAIAYMGQSPTAERTNLALYRHWNHFEGKTQLLAQTHDSITFQYNQPDEQSVIPTALKLMETTFTAPNGRKFTIPGEAKIGWNWAPFVDEAQQAKAKAQGKKPPRLNPNGLIKFNPAKPDTRQRLVGLQRVL